MLFLLKGSTGTLAGQQEDAVKTQSNARVQTRRKYLKSDRAIITAQRSLHGLSVYFLPVIPAEPFFHFLQCLDLSGITRWIGESCDGSLVIEFFIFKKAGELRELIVLHQPFVLFCIFNFKLFHSRYLLTAPLQALAFSAVYVPVCCGAQKYKKYCWEPIVNC